MIPLVFHPHYSIPFPVSHRFPMAKFSALREELVRSGILNAENEFSPGPLSLTTLMQAHESSYVQRFIRGQLSKEEINQIGLPWSEWLVERTLRAVSGTLLTAELALEHGVSCHLAGGTHHAHKSYGSGFCIFNDLAVTAIHLVESKQVKKVLILDCDVHQGDGTASMCVDYPNIETVSWHCDENYPEKKQQAGINISIKKGTKDDGYLAVLARDVPKLLDQIQPDIVLYDAGVDVHYEDRLGYLEITDEGLWRRDQYIVSQCLLRKIPLAAVIGGGYDRDIDKLSMRHSILHKSVHNLLLNNKVASLPSLAEGNDAFE